jgi:hypothetical protein
MKCHFFGILIALITSFDVYAQSSVSHTVILNIPKIASIRLTPDSEQNLTYGFNSAEKMQNGITQQEAVSYQIRSNAKWVVQVHALNPTFSYEGESIDPQIPVKLLKIRKSLSEKGFIPLGTEQITLAKGERGDFGNNNEVKIDYQFSPEFDFPRGTYSMDVALTISNP